MRWEGLRDGCCVSGVGSDSFSSSFRRIKEAYHQVQVIHSGVSVAGCSVIPLPPLHYSARKEYRSVFRCVKRSIWQEQRTLFPAQDPAEICISSWRAGDSTHIGGWT